MKCAKCDPKLATWVPLTDPTAFWCSVKSADGNSHGPMSGGTPGEPTK